MYYKIHRRDSNNVRIDLTKSSRNRGITCVRDIGSELVLQKYLISLLVDSPKYTEGVYDLNCRGLLVRFGVPTNT